MDVSGNISQDCQQYIDEEVTTAPRHECHRCWWEYDSDNDEEYGRCAHCEVGLELYFLRAGSFNLGDTLLGDGARRRGL